MKKQAKILFFVATCILCFQIGFSHLTVYDTVPGKNDKANDTAGKISPAASVPKGNTEKFILRYNPDIGKVILITRKSDGSEILSPVDEVKAHFLTNDDIAKLEHGIETSSREELFMLIEDLSS